MLLWQHMFWFFGHPEVYIIFLPGTGMVSVILSTFARRPMIGYLPIGRAEASGPELAALFWSLKTTDHDAWRANFSAWREQIVGLWPEMKPNIESLRSPDDLALASYVHFTAMRASRGPVALVGDAAHTTSPQLGRFSAEL